MRITFNNQTIIQNKYQSKHKSVIGFTSNYLNEDIFESKSYKNPSQMYFDNYNDLIPSDKNIIVNMHKEYYKVLKNIKLNRMNSKNHNTLLKYISQAIDSLRYMDIFYIFSPERKFIQTELTKDVNSNILNSIDFKDIPYYKNEKKFTIDKIINPILQKQSNVPQIIIYSGAKGDVEEFVHSLANSVSEKKFKFVYTKQSLTPINCSKEFIQSKESIPANTIYIVPDAYKYFSSASPYAKQNIEALKEVKECGAIFIMMTTEPKKLQAALGGKKKALTLSLNQQTPKELTSVLKHYMNEAALNVDKLTNQGENIKPIYEKFNYEYFKNLLELIIKRREVGYKDIGFIVDKSLSQYKKDTSKSFSFYVSEQLINMLEATSYED